jgi:hypothetical protein
MNLLNVGRASMLGFVALTVTYLISGQLIPGVF